ncbi:hypothetical protein MXD81_23005, partial [Microbacteriaceae bacterium K1510]|nr:hypothetical protein [Microbacteriaceae bacterium K1510]
PEAWENELREIEAQLPAITRFKDQLHTGGETLLACLEAEETINVRLQLVATYARLRLSEDGTNPTYQANSALVGDAADQLNAALSFIRSEILALPDGTIERYLQEERGLEPFHKSLMELLETKPHRLTAETEAVLA